MLMRFITKQRNIMYCPCSFRSWDWFAIIVDKIKDLSWSIIVISYNHLR